MSYYRIGAVNVESVPAAAAPQKQGMGPMLAVLGGGIALVYFVGPAIRRARIRQMQTKIPTPSRQFTSRMVNKDSRRLLGTGMLG